MKKIKSLGLLSVLASLVLLAGCSKTPEKGEYTVEKGKLKIAMEIGYPPFEYYDNDGKTPVGFDVELGKEIAKRLGLEAVFIDTAWDGILAGLDTDRYDAIISAMTITDERRENYDFTSPYIGNAQALIVRKDSTLDITKPEDLAGLKVGYQAETTSDFYLEDYAKSHGFGYVQCEYDQVLNAYGDLKYGRIDAVISDALVAVDYLSLPDCEYKQVWSGTPDEYMGICVKKDNDKLLNALESTLKDIKNDGTISDLYKRVFGVDLTYTISDVK